MGKHFVTVCVFCLLCATHTPCSSHVQFSSSEKRLEDIQTSVVNGFNRHAVKKTVIEKITDRFSTDNVTKALNWSSVKDLNSVNFNNISNKNKTKAKRDLHRKHKFDETVFIEKIFNSFGNGDIMTYEGFERLVKSLDLHRLLSDKMNGSIKVPGSMNNAASGLRTDANLTCMDGRDLLKSVINDQHGSDPANYSEADVQIDSSALRRLCPVLLYQVVAPSSLERQGCVVVQNNVDSDFYPDNNSVHSHKRSNDNMGSVWLYSTLSILIISACGLLGVLVIPIMQQHFYQHLIQFLVALAVGTLAGDALLHLLPHAMMSHSHDHNSLHDHNHVPVDSQDQHDKNMWRGFVAMVGVIFFFFMEKCLTVGTEWRKQRQLRKNKVPARVRVMRETDTAGSTSVGCKHKYSSYPYCYGVIATETQDDHHNRRHTHNSSNDTHNNTTTTILNDLDSDSEFLSKQCPQQETNQNMSKCTNSSRSMKCSESNKMLAENADSHTLQEFGNANPKEISESESYTVILREHETKHHGHSHTHGHVHSAPKTMSSVAWMVVMGDGLHNFTDGMAIGAAFAGSLSGGFSTAVAVFCHELPHEIGDFAVLLKAGMTARQAVVYNMLSSILCMFGMVFGVMLGNNENASSWMFAAAAGMFLYIALVDMRVLKWIHQEEDDKSIRFRPIFVWLRTMESEIPELTTSHAKEGGSLLQCALQFMGLITGLGIMLVIALYENNLKQLFHE